MLLSPVIAKLVLGLACVGLAAADDPLPVFRRAQILCHEVPWPC